MESELLRIFNEDHQPIGVATRAEIHEKGYWHETFHYWLMEKEQGIDYIFLQLRSPKKKDYPQLLDITAAGHLLANETVEDGIREVKEEIGLSVHMEELISLGILKYSVKMDPLLDNELAHVFLHRKNVPFDSFVLQEEEGAGIRGRKNKMLEAKAGGVGLYSENKEAENIQENATKEVVAPTNLEKNDASTEENLTQGHRIESKQNSGSSALGIFAIATVFLFFMFPRFSRKRGIEPLLIHKMWTKNLWVNALLLIPIYTALFFLVLVLLLVEVIRLIKLKAQE